MIKSISNIFKNVPGRGLGYETLREITLPENKKSLKFNLNPEILFNFSGDYNSSLDTAFEGLSISPLYKNLNESPESERKYTLIIELAIFNGEVILTIHYNKYQYYKSTIDKLIEGYREYLVRMSELYEYTKEGVI